MEIEAPSTVKTHEKSKGEPRGPMFELLGIPIEGLGDGSRWKQVSAAQRGIED